MTKIIKMLYSPSQRVAWEVDFFPADDEHEEDWVYPFVSASWPSDWTVGITYPYNSEGIEYVADFDSAGVLFWRVRDPSDYPPMPGGT